MQHSIENGGEHFVIQPLTLTERKEIVERLKAFSDRFIENDEF